MIFQWPLNTVFFSDCVNDTVAVNARVAPVIVGIAVVACVGGFAAAVAAVGMEELCSGFAVVVNSHIDRTAVMLWFSQVWGCWRYLYDCFGPIFDSEFKIVVLTLLVRIALFLLLVTCFLLPCSLF